MSTNRSLDKGASNLDLLPTSAYGAALLRFVLVGFWVIHWWFKVGYRGMSATEGFFMQNHLPAWLAWFDISFEVVVAVCLLLGIYVSLLCIVSLPILFASMAIYGANGFYFPNGGIELPIFWAFAQVVQALLGPGAFRISPPPWLPRLPDLSGTSGSVLIMPPNGHGQSASPATSRSAPARTPR
jgi:putative oxidoreductase